MRILLVLASFLLAVGVHADTVGSNGVAVANINGTPYFMVDLLGEVGEGIADAEWIDASSGGWAKKTVALPVNIVAKLVGGVTGTGKGAVSYAKSNPWKSILSTAVIADYVEDDEFDLFGAFESGGDDKPADTQPRDPANGVLHVRQGDSSSATIAGDVIKAGTVTQGDNSTLVIEDHSGVEERD